MTPTLGFLSDPSLATDDEERLLAAFAAACRAREPRTLAEAESVAPWDDDRPFHGSGDGRVVREREQFFAGMGARSYSERGTLAVYSAGPWRVVWRYARWSVRLTGPGPAVLVQGDPPRREDPGTRLEPGRWVSLPPGPTGPTIGLLTDAGEWILLSRRPDRG